VPPFFFLCSVPLGPWRRPYQVSCIFFLFEFVFFRTVNVSPGVSALSAPVLGFLLRGPSVVFWQKTALPFSFFSPPPPPAPHLHPPLFTRHHSTTRPPPLPSHLVFLLPFTTPPSPLPPPSLPRQRLRRGTPTLSCFHLSHTCRSSRDLDLLLQMRIALSLSADQGEPKARLKFLFLFLPGRFFRFLVGKGGVGQRIFPVASFSVPGSKRLGHSSPPG